MSEIETHPHLLKDDLIPAAMHELFSIKPFLEGMKAFLPNSLNDLILNEKENIHTIPDFQARIIYPLLKTIEKGSITQFSSSGLDKLDTNKQYLFISNHRDIVLDSAFLNTTLFENKFRTSQIAIGDNLMKHRISELIFRMNKSFVVRRTGSPMDLYRYSLLLATYIRQQIDEKIDSVWIAQREGRAKDGNDRTQTGLLKMLSLGNKGDLKKHFQALNIVPVSISYEYDPCDVLKAQEYLDKLTNPDYKKDFKEDVQHILLGLKGTKGRVHFHFGATLQESLDAFDAQPNAKKQLDILANLIDQSIHRCYQLRPINEVAYQLLKETNTYSSTCLPEDVSRETAIFEKKCQQLTNDKEGLGRKYLLSMYANPLINFMQCHNI
jgi:glycerol-3-phosphate O-acyltransferase